MGTDETLQTFEAVICAYVFIREVNKFSSQIHHVLFALCKDKGKLLLQYINLCRHEHYQMKEGSLNQNIDIRVQPHSFPH